jgi:hypothetical protein
MRHWWNWYLQILPAGIWECPKYVLILINILLSNARENNIKNKQYLLDLPAIQLQTRLNKIKTISLVKNFLFGRNQS